MPLFASFLSAGVLSYLSSYSQERENKMVDPLIKMIVNEQEANDGEVQVKRTREEESGERIWKKLN